MTDLRESIPDSDQALPASSRSNVDAGIFDLWSEFLERDGVDADDDFFTLGGDSLLAIRMLAAIEARFDVPVAFPEFAETPTISFLVTAVERGHASGAQARPALERAAVEHALPCTPAQERLWFLEEMAGARGVYNMPLGVRIPGPLNADALEAALREIVERHTALRTRFPGENGVPVQIVESHADLRVERADLRQFSDPEAEAHRIVDELASRPFSLGRDLPIRAALLRLHDEEHVLELVFHHIVCDGWSQVVVLRELGALYDAHCRREDSLLAPPRSQYADFALSRIGAAASEKRLEYWRHQLAQAPPVLQLPTDRARPQVVTYRGSTRRTRLTRELAADIRAFARAEGATVFTTLLAAYYVLLHRLSGQSGIVVGATVAGRDRSELDDAVGLYANTVALAVDLEDAPTFAELLVRARGVVRDALVHGDVPFERLVAELQPERDLSRHPIFQVFFAHVPQARLDMTGAEPFDACPSTSRFDLTLWVEEKADEQLELVWEYATDLFDDDTLARYELYFFELLSAALTDPARSLLELPLVPQAERRRVAAGSEATDEFPVGVLARFVYSASTPIAGGYGGHV